MDNILKQVRVLYVEDSQDIRELGLRMLQNRVKEVSIAIDGADGLEKFKLFNPDIIVTDITMPNMNGLEMITQIRKINKKIPIIITSTHDESDILMKSIELGVNGYLIKPLNRPKLLNTITLHSKVIILERYLKQKEKQLAIKNKNEALMDMVEHIAHQWRQPLSVISTAADSIKIGREFSDMEDAELIPILDAITDTAQELSSTIDTLGKFIDNNISIKNDFNLFNEIVNSITIIQVLLDEADIELVLDCPLEYNYTGNIELFSKAILNILYNCLDAFENIQLNKKYIFISLQLLNNKYTISIKDNAGGIEDSILDKVFEPYFTTYHQSRGKGLGLYNVYNTVHNHFNGDIRIENIQYLYNENNYSGCNVIINL